MGTVGRDRSSSSPEPAYVALFPDGVTIRTFLGAACLCGIGDTVALLMADQAFVDGVALGVARKGVADRVDSGGPGWDADPGHEREEASN